MLALKLVFTAVCVAVGYHFRPFSISKEVGAAAGLLFALAVIFFETRLQRISLRRLIGASVGSILGILGAYLTSLIFTHTTMPESTRSFFSLAVFLVMTYIGMVSGCKQGRHAELAGVRRRIRQRTQHQPFVQAARYQRDHRRASGEISPTRCFSMARLSFHISYCASCSWWPIRPTR